MKRTLIDSYDGRAVKKRGATELENLNHPPPNGHKIVEYLDAYNRDCEERVGGNDYNKSR